MNVRVDAKVRRIVGLCRIGVSRWKETDDGGWGAEVQRDRAIALPWSSQILITSLSTRWVTFVPCGTDITRFDRIPGWVPENRTSRIECDALPL